MSSSTPAPALRTLFLCDLVDSTKVVARLGDARAADVFARHDRLALELFAGLGGRVVSKTDGFLALFNRPIDAVRCALEYHAGLDGLEGADGRRLSARVGVHLGEVMIGEEVPEDGAPGMGQMEFGGLAVSVCARVMSLATGGQTLMTRGAFDLARRAAVGDAAFGGELRWLAHGPYLFKGVEEPVDVFEAGVAGRAPLAPPPNSEKAVRAVAPGDDATLGWRPAVGLSVPQRSHWLLAERLGEGGFGEVWLAEHAKTHERRVFKFCFDVDRLRGLKREVTLFRLLKETLGDRDDIARVLDWNFDEAPYFIESEHTGGGNLIDWADARGGLASVPLATRLDLVAQVAEALGAAHSVGVLHKDIKPSNVLVVEERDGRPRARLTDFGIGIITDRERLAQAGVTATGLTEVTLAGNDSSRTGTRLYMAPELLEGRTATIQSDLFALGVMLFQGIVGDFRRALPSDWRDEVADELLREDVAACVAGDPRKRLANAARLAERLRDLEARRAELIRARTVAAEAEAALGAVERARRLRRVLLAISITGMIVITTISWLALNLALQKKVSESNRKKAVAARAEAEEMVGFLLEDLSEKLEPIGRLDVLDVVLAKVQLLLNSRNSDAPSPQDRMWRASLMLQVASVRVGQGKLEEAGEAAGRAFEEATSLTRKDPRSSEFQRSLSSAWAMRGTISLGQGRLEEALAAHQSALEINQQLALSDPGNALRQADLAIAWRDVGTTWEAKGDSIEARRAFENYRAIIEKILESEPSNPDWQQEHGTAWNRIGRVAESEGDLEEALQSFNRYLSIAGSLSEAAPSDSRRKDSVAIAWGLIGNVLEKLGRAQESWDAFDNYRRIFEALSESDPANVRWQREHAIGLNRLGRILKARGEHEAATKLFDQHIKIIERLAALDPTNAGWQMDLGIAWGLVGEERRREGSMGDSKILQAVGLGDPLPTRVGDADHKDISPGTPLRLLVLGRPPSEGRGVWIAGNSEQIGDWTPNKVALTHVADIAPFAIWEHRSRWDAAMEFKFTYGLEGQGWVGTEEWQGMANRRLQSYRSMYKSAEGELIIITFFGIGG